MNIEYRLEIFPILTIIFFPDRKSGLIVKDEIKNWCSEFEIINALLNYNLQMPDKLI